MDRSLQVARGAGKVYRRSSSCQAQEMPSLKAERRRHPGGAELGLRAGGPFPPCRLGAPGGGSRGQGRGGAGAPARDAGPPGLAGAHAHARRRRVPDARPGRAPPGPGSRSAPAPPGERGPEPLPSPARRGDPRGHRACQPPCPPASLPRPGERSTREGCGVRPPSRSRRRRPTPGRGGRAGAYLQHPGARGAQLLCDLERAPHPVCAPGTHTPTLHPRSRTWALEQGRELVKSTLKVFLKRGWGAGD